MASKSFKLIRFDEAGTQQNRDDAILRLVCIIEGGGKIAVLGSARSRENIDSLQRAEMPCDVVCDCIPASEYWANTYGLKYWVPLGNELRVLAKSLTTIADHDLLPVRERAAESGSTTAADGPRKGPIVPRLGAIYEKDPVLLYRLRSNASAEMQVLGRTVIMDVDATGCRPVIGQPIAGERTLAVYGCSFTYGIAISADETFCSVLQGRLPTWRVENRGVSAYSTASNLIQLERETLWNKAEFVTFCWIGQHLFRNTADINWVQLTSENMLRFAIHEVPEQRVPRATLDTNGVLQMRSVRVPRGELLGIDLSDFATDRFHADVVCFRLFERANAIVTGYGGHFFVTTLQDELSAGLERRLSESGIPVVNASLSGNEYLCLPDDPHPNARANQIYAERIHEYLSKYMAAQRVNVAGAVSATDGVGADPAGCATRRPDDSR